MDTGSLSYKTLKNISYNFIGYFWPFIFSLFITPIIVLRLGVEKYGIYMLVMAISALMGLFDLGIGSTMVKYISEYQSKEDNDGIKRLVYSFNYILLGLGVFGFAALTLIGFWADTLFPSSLVSSGYYLTLFFITGLIFFMNTISATYTVIPSALQRFDISTKLGLFNLTFSSLIILALVLSGFGLRAILTTQLVFTLFTFFLFRHYARRLMPIVKLKYVWNTSEVVNAYKFGVATYVSNAANASLSYFDRLFIPFYLGPAALSYYSLPGNFTAKTPSLINNISAVIFPMISSLNGVDDIGKIKEIYVRVFNLITVLTFAITISIIMFANKIMLYWLNADFAAKSSGVMVVLALTYYFLTLAGLLNSFLLGLSKTKFLFKSSLFMALVNVVLLFALLPKFGIMGAAWAYLLSVLPIIFMFYYTEKSFLKLSGRLSYYAKMYLKLSVTALVFIPIVKFFILPLVLNLKLVIVFGPVSVALFLVLYKLFGFYDSRDIELINNFIRLLVGRIRSKKYAL
jgi:O-antigen/teichoic acid export membrane protein